MSDSKVIDLARKLMALAERGEGGERVNASTLLTRHLEKHGITIADIEGAETSQHVLKIGDRKKQVFVQVIIMVLGKSVDVYASECGTALFFDCTPAQYIEIDAASDFFARAYEEELKAFTLAFIYKNNLLPYDAEPTTSSDMSAKELWKIRRMMENIEKKTLRKQLKP